ncbi:MAG: hypothetical protein ABI575_05500 [Oxalobacteraceae bacterium]
MLRNQFDSEPLALGYFETAIRYEIQPEKALAGIAALKEKWMAQGLCAGSLVPNHIKKQEYVQKQWFFRIF